MATFDWTSTIPNPASTAIVRSTNSRPARSPLTGATTVDVRAGSKWVYTLNWVNLTAADRAEVLAFFSRLNGLEHRQRLIFFGETNQRGSWSGTPLVDGAAQTGSSLNLDGFTASQSGIIQRGDFFRIAGLEQLFQVTRDGSSDAGGNVADLTFWPPLRSSPADNAAIELTGAPYFECGVFMLVTDLEHENLQDVLVAGSPELRSSLTLTFEEDVLA